MTPPPALCALALLLAAAAAACARAAPLDAPAPAHMSPMPFLMNVRYGRSSPAAPDLRTRTLRLEPRADRFFMGTRYGKRSQPAHALAHAQADGALVCRYTGVVALYRCYGTDEHEHEDEDEHEHEHEDEHEYTSREEDPRLR